MNSIEKNSYIYFPLVTIGEAAKFLGVGRKVIYQLIEFEQIRAVREKRTILIEKRSLEDFKSSGKLT